MPGTESGLRLYSAEIVDYLQLAIGSSSWKLKSQSAAAIESMARILKTNFDTGHSARLVRILLDGLAGRTWDGKEHLLHALASLVNAGQPISDVAIQSSLKFFNFLIF